MLRALSLAALVLLCSATSLLAQERHIATYGGVSGSLGPQWLGVDRRIFEKYGTKIEWVLMTGGVRGIQALLRGSIPVLSSDELDLYDVEFKDGQNCVAVEDGRWRETVRKLARAEESEIRRMRTKIDAMFEEFLNYPAMAKRIRARVGVDS